MTRVFYWGVAFFISFSDPWAALNPVPVKQVSSLVKKRMFQTSDDGGLLLLPNPNVKKYLLLSAASEFSGALKWAHEKGIRGQKISGAVVEYGDVVLEDVLILGIITDEVVKTQHAKDVKKLMKEVAPEARLQTILLHKWYTPEMALNLFWIKEKIKKVRVVNYSMGTSLTVDGSYWHEYAEKNEDLIRLLSYGIDKVIVCAAGNESINLSKSYIKFMKLPKNVIFAGALTQKSGMATFTNRPGKRKDLQNRMLFTLGAEVLIHPYRKRERMIHGTSFAAPIISGAALLICSAYPHFKSEDVTEVLLESADRSFFQRSNTENGYAEYYYYDPEDGAMAVDSLGPYVLVRPFDPTQMGKGILNIRNALIYAKIKDSNPSAKPAQIRKGMKKILMKENNIASGIIQKAFQRFQEMKKWRTPAIHENSHK